jgi:hypothetical protein
MADIPVFPVTLPQPRANGYGIAPKAAYVSTDMDSGRARNRRRFTTSPSNVTVTWWFTLAQFATFEGFIEYELNGGGKPFQVTLLNGMGINPMIAKFVNDPPYQASLGDNRVWFYVTAILQVKKLPVVPRDEYDVLVAYSEQDIIAMSDPLHNLIHVRLPGPARWN